jgi:hypothetical protein
MNELRFICKKLDKDIWQGMLTWLAPVVSMRLQKPFVVPQIFGHTVGFADLLQEEPASVANFWKIISAKSALKFGRWGKNSAAHIVFSLRLF